MDARTYALAAHIAKEKGDKRANKFRMVAVDTWNKKYGIGDYTSDKKVYHGRKMTFIPNPSTTYNYQPDQYGIVDWYQNLGNGFNGQTVIFFRPMTYKDGFFGEVRTAWGDNYSLNVKELKKKLLKVEGFKVAKQMTENTGKYIPGKGWK